MARAVVSRPRNNHPASHVEHDDEPTTFSETYKRRIVAAHFGWPPTTRTRGKCLTIFLTSPSRRRDLYDLGRQASRGERVRRDIRIGNVRERFVKPGIPSTGAYSRPGRYGDTTAINQPSEEYHGAQDECLEGYYRRREISRGGRRRLAAVEHRKLLVVQLPRRFRTRARVHAQRDACSTTPLPPQL